MPDEDLGERVRDGVFTSDTAALTVLCKWTNQTDTRKATGRTLFDALAAIPRRDVAACFAEQLLGTGQTFSAGCLLSNTRFVNS